MTFKEIFMEWWIRPEMYYIKRHLRFLRKEEEYTFDQPNKLLCFWYRSRKNRLGSRLTLQVLRSPAVAVCGN